MTIEKRLERVEAILDARGLDWDHPRVDDEPVKEPPKKWRILEPGEVVQEGDLMNSKLNPPSDPPNGGWLAAPSFYFGKEASFYYHVYFARPVADEPVKEPEPEHLAGPKPDPGEGYRILAKNPPEDLQPGDEFELAPGVWDESSNARSHKIQHEEIWYRRKIEAPEPEYREPVLPGDSGRVCEFSNDGEAWGGGLLGGWSRMFWISDCGVYSRFARIKKEA